MTCRRLRATDGTFRARSICRWRRSCLRRCMASRPATRVMRSISGTEYVHRSLALNGVALLLAEIDAAGQLAHETGRRLEHLGLEHRGIAQGGVQPMGRRFAYTPARAAGAAGPVPDARAPRVPIWARRWRPAIPRRRPCRPQGGRGQRVAREVDCDATEGLGVQLEVMTEALADLFQDADALGDHFGTDAIAGDDCDRCFHSWTFDFACS